MKKPIHETPAGLTYDVLHEVKRAMRILRKVEKRIQTEHRAQKRHRAKSDEWQTMQRIKQEEEGIKL